MKRRRRKKENETQWEELEISRSKKATKKEKAFFLEDVKRTSKTY